MKLTLMKFFSIMIVLGLVSCHPHNQEITTESVSREPTASQNSSNIQEELESTETSSISDEPINDSMSSEICEIYEDRGLIYADSTLGNGLVRFSTLSDGSLVAFVSIQDTITREISHYFCQSSGSESFDLSVAGTTLVNDIDSLTLLPEGTHLGKIPTLSYSEKFNKFLYIKRENNIDGVYNELWSYDVELGVAHQIVSELEENVFIDFFYPDDVYWISEDLLYINTIYLDYEEKIVDIDSREYFSFEVSCPRTMYFDQLSFSPNGELAIYILPTSPSAEDMVSIYLLNTETLFSNVAECSDSIGSMTISNLELFLKDSTQLDLPILHRDAHWNDPVVFWGSDSESIYLIDRNSESVSFGDLIRFDLFEGTAQTVVAYEEIAEIMSTRSEPQKFLMTSDSKYVYFLNLGSEKILVKAFVLD